MGIFFRPTTEDTLKNKENIQYNFMGGFWGLK